LPTLPVAQTPPLADELLALLPASPDAYAQKMDVVRELVLLVRFSEGAYRAASFLDDRILQPSTQGAWLPLDQVDAASRSNANPRQLHFIFHTGHVGSTLISRLLDDTGEVLSLREPLPLRTLADAHDVLGQAESLLSDAQFQGALAMFVRLWRRGYPATRSSVVKATSSTGRIAVPILSLSEGSRAIYMNLRAEPYLATLLAGQNSPLDLRGHGAERIRRLQSRIATPLAPLHALSIGELAALSWLAETLSQLSAVNGSAGRVVALDFDQFLGDVGAGMTRVLDHFGLAGNDRYLAAVGRSPALTRYSKAPEFAYTPDLRAEVLRDSRRDNREEIGKGMDWLARLAKAEPTVAGALSGTGN
jgi:hypothetical protein